MKIAIVGSGISGLTCAYYLSKKGHDISLFEANDYIGGHTHTIHVKTDHTDYWVDTGFIVFNEVTYPNFTKLLGELQVKTELTDMSFGVHCTRTNFQYAGGSANRIFAYRRNLLSPQFYKFIFEIRRYQRLAHQIILENKQNLTVMDFLAQHKFSAFFADYYLYPLVSALWSASAENVSWMPIYFIAKFMESHALLKLIPDLSWKVVSGGSIKYVEAITQSFASKIYRRCPIKKIIRNAEGAFLYGERGEVGKYDKVIIATHSDQALALFDDPMPLEQEILSQFAYEKHEVFLHSDEKQMPSLKRVWASWNYRAEAKNKKAALTYHMNRLQNISAPQDFFVTLNPKEAIDSEKMIDRFYYATPQYTKGSLAAQKRQGELNRQGNHIYYCGAYWGFGFHEDGVKSALAVCREFDKHRA